MRAHLDDEQPELLDELPFLYFGIYVALLVLGLSLWFAQDFDLLAASQAEATWDAAFGVPVDRTTPLIPDSTEIVMQRSACEGWCPVYEVRIRSDGQVYFYGDRFVCAFGDRTATADPYAVRHLIRAMEAARFGQIPSGHSNSMDLQTTTLLLVSEHRVKGAVYQDGDDEALIEMGERVDELAGTYRWLPIVTAIGRECPRASGTVRFR
jgi:hypothetical protein